MAIYKSSEMNTVIHRIKEKTVQNQIVLGALLPEQEILAFEQAAGVTLPEGFRRFLLEIGNGCTWKRERKMLPFPPANAEETARLSLPFPYETEYIWGDDASEAETNDTMNGTLELIDIGCCQTFQLIVTGPCSGEVWHFSEMGVQPCCQRQDLLGWFEKWLDEGDGVDYFAEYPYE